MALLKACEVCPFIKEGIDLQAVQHTAEKNGGYCRFHYGDGVFTANVMLRGKGNL